MHPWELRLRDLSNLLAACGKTYFSPDLFRQNTNQFLQTSRTVTFIIQKNKASISDFDRWYKENVLSPWSDDSTMTWAKDARNVIEKEGDLEMFSSLRATLLFSYIGGRDVVVTTTKSELLKAGVDELLRHAVTDLSPGVADAAVLKMERRWVANSLPNQELLSAMTYVYSRLFYAVSSLASHLRSTIDKTIPHPTELDPTSNDAPKTRYIKLGKTWVGRLATERVFADKEFQPPSKILAIKEELATASKPQSLSETVDLLARVAKATFDHHGNHFPILFLFDDAWKLIDLLLAKFEDQSEKFIFWRYAGERAAYLRAYAVVWISESWIRDMKNSVGEPLRELPIIGEQLNVIGAAIDGAEYAVQWEINREQEGGNPILVPTKRTKEEEIFFLKPVIEAMQAARSTKNDGRS